MNKYWSQWSHEEIMSMHGIEREEFKEEQERDEDEPAPRHIFIPYDQDMLTWEDFF